MRNPQYLLLSEHWLSMQSGFEICKMDSSQSKTVQNLCSGLQQMHSRLQWGHKGLHELLLLLTALIHRGLDP